MKLEIRTLDIWGNENDGFEVNDVFGVCATIEVDDEATNAEIIAALISNDVLYPETKKEKYELDEFCDASGDEYILGNVCHARNGKPICELRVIKNEGSTK